MTTHDDIRAALADISGEWDFEAVGDEYETTGYLSVGEASIDTVSESIAYDDAYFIANAPAWIRQLLDENARLAKVGALAVDFYPYAHNIAKGLADYQPSDYHAAQVMTNSVEKMAALVEAAKEYDNND